MDQETAPELPLVYEVLQVMSLRVAKEVVKAPLKVMEVLKARRPTLLIAG